MVLMYRWDGDALKIIERERVTGMSGVPIMARADIPISPMPTPPACLPCRGGAQVPPDQVLKSMKR
jgi:long-chain acyl-CoA synthetase